MRKVVPYLKLLLSIFYLDFLESVRSPFDQISLDYFKLIQINAKPYCSSRLGHPALSGRHARPPSAPSPPALSGRHARVRHIAVSVALGPLQGAVRRSGPGPTAPHSRDPHLFPPLSPLPRCHRAARSPLALLHSFSHPHSSLTPPLERPSFPTTPRTRTTTSGHRQPLSLVDSGRAPPPSTIPPVSSSPSYQSPKFLANPSLPRLS
jgi:hypothetical protein